MNRGGNPTIGVMGSAAAIEATAEGERLRKLAQALGRSIADRKLTLFTGATTGLIYEVGKAGRDHGALHIGISPGSSRQEHVNRYELPTDACDVIVYTGFGLKGRNVVLIRSCEIAIFIAGATGSLNEFTIAHDEGKIIGCLTGTGGVADEVGYLLQKFSHHAKATVVQNNDPEDLIANCISRWEQRNE